MIVPLPTRARPGRFRAWATLALVSLCAALYLGNLLVAHRRLAAGVEHLEEAARFQAERPQLTLPAGVAAALGPRVTAPEGPSRDYAALEQAELDGLTLAAVEGLAETPHGRWGLVPARLSVVSLFTHPFLHAGLLPLLANLLLLYLLAPFLEEAWGPLALWAFCLVAAAVTGGLFAAANPVLELPLAGASGVAAAVVGAVTVRFWSRRLDFRVRRPRAGEWITAAAASWLALPVWSVRVGLAGLGGDLVAPGGGGGLALWAHAGGLVFGAGVAGAALRFHLEERLLHASRPSTASAGFWPPVLFETRQPASDPSEGRAEGGEPSVLVRDLLRAGQPGDAYGQWRRWQAAGCGGGLAPAVEARLAEELLRVGDRAGAAAVARGALGRAGGDTPTGTLCKLAGLVESADRDRVAALLLSRPDLPAGERRRMEIWASPGSPPDPGNRLRPAEAGVSGTRTGPTPPAPAGSGGVSLSPVPVTPVELRGEDLVVELPGRGARALPLRRLRAVAAAALDDGTPAEPNLILDLFLEEPPRAAAAVQVLRVETFRWDPRALMPTEPELEDAFLSFAGALLAGSGASWLLGESSRRLPRYRGLEAYERSLLSVLRLSADPGAAG